VAGERQAAAILDWSWWRRWHQATAAWHHMRRRAAALAPVPTAAAPPAVAPERPAEDAHPPDDGALTDTLARVWARLAARLPTTRRAGRQVVYDRRRILEAIVYVMQTDCGWSALPSSFPPWKTVHDQFVAWRKAGIWNQIWEGITPPGPRL
jgi:Putative transposase of IS4/5 family (DUF4096)